MNETSEAEELVVEIEAEKEEVEDESESEKREGGSRKQEKWECPGCKKSMQRANKNRHVRRCEIVVEPENTIEGTVVPEEENPIERTEEKED